MDQVHRSLTCSNSDLSYGFQVLAFCYFQRLKTSLMSIVRDKDCKESAPQPESRVHTQILLSDSVMIQLLAVTCAPLRHGRHLQAPAILRVIECKYDDDSIRLVSKLVIANCAYFVNYL